ncbi:MAG: hypothetical protein ACLT0Y_08320 [Christensenellales bacterium]
MVDKSRSRKKAAPGWGWLFRQSPSPARRHAVLCQRTWTRHLRTHLLKGEAPANAKNIAVCFCSCSSFRFCSRAILLCRIQDAALVGVVHTNPVSTAPSRRGQPLTMPEKIELICRAGT